MVQTSRIAAHSREKNGAHPGCEPQGGSTLRPAEMPAIVLPTGLVVKGQVIPSPSLLWQPIESFAPFAVKALIAKLAKDSRQARAKNPGATGSMPFRHLTLQPIPAIPGVTMKLTSRKDSFPAVGTEADLRSMAANSCRPKLDT